MWGHFDKTTDMYQMIAKINNYRKESKFYNEDTIQRYADSEFYAFSRGKKMLVCLTRGISVQRTITYHSFDIGSKLCDLLDPNDCITVNSDGINVKLGQDPKVYVIQ